MSRAVLEGVSIVYINRNTVIFQLSLPFLQLLWILVQQQIYTSPQKKLQQFWRDFTYDVSPPSPPQAVFPSNHDAGAVGTSMIDYFDGEALITFWEKMTDVNHCPSMILIFILMISPLHESLRMEPNGTMYLNWPRLGNTGLVPSCTSIQSHMQVTF